MIIIKVNNFKELISFLEIGYKCNNYPNFNCGNMKTVKSIYNLYENNFFIQFMKDDSFTISFKNKLDNYVAVDEFLLLNTLSNR